MDILKPGYLSTIDIFSDLSSEELRDLNTNTTLVSSPRGKIIYMPGEKGESLYLLAVGRVQLYRLAPNGKKLVIRTLGPGNFFGERVLLGQGIHDAFAESIEDCLFYTMYRTNFERLMRRKPQVAMRLVEAMGFRLSQLETSLEEFTFKNIPARLACLLLRSADRDGEGTEVRGFSHQELSDMMGSYRETITHTLNDFKAKGLIETGRKRISLLDRNGLETLSAS